MALIGCEECGKQVSDRAAACPNCGAPPFLARPPSYSGGVLQAPLNVGDQVAVIVPGQSPGYAPPPTLWNQAGQITAGQSPMYNPPPASGYGPGPASYPSRSGNPPSSPGIGVPMVAREAAEQCALCKSANHPGAVACRHCGALKKKEFSEGQKFFLQLIWLLGIGVAVAGGATGHGVVVPLGILIFFSSFVLVKPSWYWVK